MSRFVKERVSAKNWKGEEMLTRKEAEKQAICYARIIQPNNIYITTLVLGQMLRLIDDIYFEQFNWPSNLTIEDIPSEVRDIWLDLLSINGMDCVENYYSMLSQVYAQHLYPKEAL